MASVATWSTTAASNTSVGGISTDGNVTLVNQIDNMTRGMMVEVATSRDDGTIINVYPRGYLFGLTLSNNASDATNDIDIAAGECVAETTPYWRIALASVLTKRLDAAWAVGTNQGGLDTGAIANTTYHIWLIARSDTGVVDALFSTSATSPTMPASYDRKRRIGSIMRAAATIRPFVQDGDQFMHTTPVADINATNPGITAVTRTLSVPLGIRVKCLLSVGFNSPGNTDTPSAIYVSDLSLTDTNAGTANAVSLTVHTTFSGISLGAGTAQVMSNTSGQIRSRQQFSGTNTQLFINTNGWEDTRGRLK